MGQAEWLMILTCAGYVAPYAWDRYRETFLGWYTDIRIHKTRGGTRHYEFWDGSYLLVPARLEFRELTFTEQLETGFRNAVQNSGGQTMILPHVATSYTSLYDEGYQPHCRNCAALERQAGRRIEYCLGDHTQ